MFTLCTRPPSMLEEKKFASRRCHGLEPVQNVGRSAALLFQVFFLRISESPWDVDEWMMGLRLKGLRR